MDRLELRRQLIHASGVAVALAVKWGYHRFGGWMAPAAALTAALALGYGFSYLHRMGAHLPILTEVILSSEREHDRDFPGRGALRFFTGALLVLLIFRSDIEIVAAAIVVLALGDSASTLGGLAFGRHRLPHNGKKSFEGSLSGFVAAFLGLALIAPFPLSLSAAASLTGVAVESLPLEIDDNITVPISTGFVIWLFKAGIII
ncbi:MAG: hypothetical protein D6733_02775 [Methanobacteriota archaeon]|nr:MAG: hypothetical protein D6733_02775 [Euryarchaeota archaeon]